MTKDRTNYKDTELQSELEKSAGVLSTGIQKQYWKKSVYPLFKEVIEKMNQYRALFNSMQVLIAADTFTFTSLGKLNEYMLTLEGQPLGSFKMHFKLLQFGVGSKDKYFDLEAGLEVKFEDKQHHVILLDNSVLLKKDYSNHLSQKEAKQIVNTYINDIEERLDKMISTLA